MKKQLLYSLLFGMFAVPSVFGADYGLPSGIQEGNILHCFNWPAKEVKNALPQIAAAGFGTVQLSPLQRGDVNVGSPWHDLYRPYDLAFKPSGYCSEADLRDLCSAAATYGIKIIVDVVANHVDKTAGYHDTWWDANGRVRWNGGINYGDRYSITHGQLGDYGDINSEDSEVAARGKAYVEKLKSLGVKGCRWDAAKHIGLPSEGCNFWREVTSVPGMYHYGEILDAAGPNPSIIKEYTNYMSVTDNKYSNGAAKDNGGIAYGYGGDHVVNQGCADTKMVYWAESHDTYSNDEWSMNVDQSVIDRAYACYACRNGAAALYLSRPKTKGFNNIKVGVGTDAYKSKHISEVNKFRNAMVGRKDWCEAGGNTFCVTREGGGAVIVTKGSGNVSVTNGGGFCPAGTYTDRVSGGTFTVTSTTISGNVGSSGIAVLIKDGLEPPIGGGGEIIDPPVVTDGDMWILGNLEGAAGWSKTPGTGAAMTLTNGKYVAKNVKMVKAANETKCYFNLTDYVGATWDDLNMNANRYGAATEGVSITLGSPAAVTKYANGVDASGCLSWTVAEGTYDFTFDPSAMTITVVNAGGGGGNDDPIIIDPPVTGDDHYIYYDGTFTNPTVWAWTSSANCNSNGTWPGDKMTKQNGKWYWALPAGKSVPENVIISENGGAKAGGGDLVYVDKATYHNDGTYSTGGDDPIIITPPVGEGDMWILGNIDGHQWTTNSGATMTLTNGKYVANGVKLTAAADETTCYFNITDKLGASWDELNMVANRYGAATEGAPITLGSPATVTKYANGVDASGCLSWTIAPGTYDFTFDLSAMTLTVVNAGDNPPIPTKPVVTANPASGTTFTESLSVSLSVSPAATIYYSLGGTATTSSTVYSGPISISQTTTISTLAVAEDGTQNAQTFSYTKRQGDDPVVVTGNNLITDYYKVNPNGQVGTFKTINMTGHPATNAFSNWSASDLIAQGVARDVCQALKGTHERPIVDSYALYAAYDNDNLYLGVQFVYTIWDTYGEGKQPGESKPYNMDGHMCIALDLDPNKSFDGYINGTGPMWNEQQKGAKFNNGVDAVIMCSTKPGVGTPGLFLPTPDGHASYDAAYCKGLPAGFWGYKDGLLPSIEHVWGQSEFYYDTEALKGNTGFVDLRSEIDDSAHTFYEFKIPLSTLGITADYIRNTGIGVMYLDKYGSSPVGGTPYDPSFFDNATDSYSQDPSSSKEKEDEDVITYSPARVGKLGSVTAVELPTVDEAAMDVEPVYFTLQGVKVQNPSNGLYIVVRGNKVTKEYIR